MLCMKYRESGYLEHLKVYQESIGGLRHDAGGIQCHHHVNYFALERS